MKIAALVITAAAVAAGYGIQDQAKRTSRDRVFSKAQATRGAETYAKICASCHDPAKVPAGKKAGPVLVGDKFFEEWKDRTLGGLLETTLLTMPNDGSAVLTEEQTADVIAYVLQANGLPDGPADLTYAGGADIVIVK